MAITYGPDKLTESEYLTAKKKEWDDAAATRAFASLRSKRNELLTEIEQIKTGGWPEISRSINLARENFLEEFSRNQGADCAKNIALRIFSKT